MSARWARAWFAATAFCAAAGVVISVYTAVQTPGRFHTGFERGLNTFAFFTIQSNLIVGATTLLLAVRPGRSSMVFRVFRLIGLVAITVTGLVYHVALSRLFDLEGWHQLGNQLVHTAVPILAVTGWLLFGPRRLTSARVAWLSLLFPVAWVAFTLIRGAGWHWYPYPFIDVTTLGYGKVALNCCWVALLLLGLAAGATLLDRRLAGSATPSYLRDTGRMVDDDARDRAIYHALKAADEVAAALQAHLIEEHGADPERSAAQGPATNSLKLLRQARERLGQGLRAVHADTIAESDGISLRNR